MFWNHRKFYFLLSTERRFKEILSPSVMEEEIYVEREIWLSFVLGHSLSYVVSTEEMAGLLWVVHWTHLAACLCIDYCKQLFPHFLGLHL